MPQSFAISNFRGLHDRRMFGQDMETTTSLDNVLVRNGTVKGRGGLALWDGIDTAAASTIVGFAEFYAPNTATSSLLRMRTLGVDKWNDGTNSWDDITGTALTGDTSTRPVFHTMSDEGLLVFTNEGHDLPRKWTGSGNTASLGGSPPYCKWLCPFVGFLFLLNTSTDGTFSAAADPITAYFSDSPDSDWDTCTGNQIIFDESAGEIRAAGVFGESMIVFKSDALVNMRWAGGLVRFNRRRLPFSQGILAPMSLQSIGEAGLIFLATDYNLYRTDGNQVIPLPLAVQKALRETMTPSKAPYVSGYVDLTNETYHLLYQRNSSTYFDGRLSVNYRTGEFTRGAYTGYEFTRGFAYRQTNNTNSQLLVASSTHKVYEQESGADDAGTRVSRYYDIDWHQYGTPGSKWFLGANLVFKRATNVQVRISVAKDHSNKFEYPRTYSLKGQMASDTNVRVKYEIPSPPYGSWFKVRIEFIHAGTGVGELLEYEPILHQTAPIPQDEPHQNQAQKSY